MASKRRLSLIFSAAFIALTLMLIALASRGIASKGAMNIESALGVIFVVSLFISRLKGFNSGIFPSEGIAPFVLPSLAVVPFLITARAPFLFDAYSHVLTASTESFRQVLRTSYSHPTGGDFFFRPLGYLDYWIDARWAGFSPLLWNLSNLLFHLIAVYLLLLLCKQLGLSGWACALTALLFGVHGAGPEVVSWVAARFDELATCFVLLTLILLCAYADQKSNAYPMVGSCVCALLSKESAFCIPGLAACCLWYRGKFNKRGLSAICILVLTCAVVGAYRWWALGGIGGYKDTTGLPTVLHFNLLHVLYLLLFRMWGVLMFPINWSEHLPGWLLAILLLFGICAAATMLLSRPNRRMVFASVAFAMISILPAAPLP